MEQLFGISVEWDGLKLVARPVVGPAWLKLVGKRPGSMPRTVLDCTALEDVTPFEVGAFLAAAAWPLMDAWSNERLAARLLDDSLTMFPLGEAESPR